MSQTQLLLEEQLCFPIYAASRMITRLYQPYLDELGLTYPQYLAMLVLWEKDAISVTAMGERLLLNTNTLTPLLKKLEAKGLLQRRRSEKDVRSIILHLTKTGTDLEEQAVKIPLAMTSKINLPEEEFYRLRRDVKQLLTSLIEVDNSQD